VAGPISEPKIEIIVPGARGPDKKLAPLTMAEMEQEELGEPMIGFASAEC
jgi:hypothetical protein